MWTLQPTIQYDHVENLTLILRISAVSTTNLGSSSATSRQFFGSNYLSLDNFPVTSYPYRPRDMFLSACSL